MLEATVTLAKPTSELLPGYLNALKAGWSPDNVRKEIAAREQLEAITKNAAHFLEALDDPDAKGAPIPLPDGSTMSRLPSITRWIWDGEFCGAISFRWQHGLSTLPPNVLGHIGFAVVPWKRRNGYATAALTLMSQEAKRRGLLYVELTVAPENISSQNVIERCGGIMIERFRKSAAYDTAEALRYRIDLQG